MKRAVLAAALMLGGCAHVELEYRGDIELDDGREGTVVYNASYPTGGHQIACILTGIFYGGWCWAYLGMPLADQTIDIERDTEAFIDKRFDGKAELTGGQSRRLSWQDVRARAKVKVRGEPPKPASPPPAEQKPPAPAPPDADPDDRDGADNAKSDRGWSDVGRRPAPFKRETGVKLIFPYVLGLGVALDILDDTSGAGAELGIAAVINNYSGHYAQVEYAVAEWDRRELRLGLEYLVARHSDAEYVHYRGFTIELVHFGDVGIEYAHLLTVDKDMCLDHDGNGDCYPTMDMVTITYRI